MRHFDNEISEGVDNVTLSSKSEISEIFKYLFVFFYLIPSLLTSKKVTLESHADPNLEFVELSVRSAIFDPCFA